ncbi:MAG: DNA polymerase III subunit gamma/tau [Candidatus Saccharimonadales bacterium]
MSVALYRKYRSKSLSDIVGQQHITDTLSRALKQGKVAHAYLLTGPRGVGKTSIARILAHEINQLPYTDESSHLDIIEIDAASNNGVDDVRDLRDKVQLAPISAQKKVYIIDEVHMLSKPAFNALLKTLEEPPEHVVFILATTNIEKLPDTIISRTQRFGFRPIPTEDAAIHLKTIATQENIRIDDEALTMIAKLGNGSFRDSISLLDQLSSLSDTKTGITPPLIEQVLGLASTDIITQLIEAVLTESPATIVTILARGEREGLETSILIDQLIDTIRQRIIDTPTLLPLLDGLIAASTSPRPSVKLLSVLLTAATPSAPARKPTTIALEAPTPTISAPVQQLRKQQPIQPTPAPNQTPVPDIPMPTRIAADAHPEQFDWDTLVEFARSNHVALHSVLSKCSYRLDGDTLTLYTIRKFNKTKLDDAKYRAVLAECLIHIGAGDLLIETIPTAAPPTDETAAAVAALMGGGEQVSVEE